MIERKYFGIISEKFISLDKSRELEDFLIEHKLIVWVKKGKTISTSKTDNLGEQRIIVEFDPKNAKYEFSKELLKHVYNFLLDHYKNGLGRVDFFNNDFENETFGLLEGRKRDIALKHFNNNYKLWTTNLPVILEYNEKNKLGSENPFNKLKRVRLFFQNHLKHQNELISAYLNGNINYFNRELFDTSEFLKEMFDFENDLLILLDLNNDFSFAEDKAFSPKSKADLIYEQYSHDFHSLKQVKFIEKQFSNEENRKYSFAVSIFYFFNDQLLMPSADLFKEIITKYFGFNCSKIKLNDESNSKHKKRLNKLKIDWNNY